ncbi:MAG TPA: ATP-binding cassette domain-containing protein [Candidatus Kapabacteria bacterium]|nr:ATP-binding cassette domain-containing protein [Candidatus Kapabacteria bacterium]
MLSAKNLYKKFASTVAVDNVSFTVEQGKVFGLLGPNGAGKTTTIRMLLNIITPDSGEVYYDNLPITEETKNHVGYLPEERGLYRKGIVIETILYFAALKNMESAVAKRTAMQWLERFKLEDRAKSKIEELSKGNQQKVQFIISVLHDPAVLVLDEPFSGFDPVNQELLKEMIIEQKAHGKAIIFSTHQMEQAEKLCDAICVINRGKVVLEGSLGDVKKKFGKNSLHVEFRGDNSVFNALPNVDHADVYNNYAELRMKDGQEINAVAKYLVDKVSLQKLELVEPSLHSIFIDVVGAQE